MVSFPDEFLAEVDRVAREEHRTRSELLREAARAYLAARAPRRRPIDDPRIRRAVEAQDQLSRHSPGADEDSTAEVRWWREHRWGKQPELSGGEHGSD